MNKKENKITFRSMCLGTILSCFFAVLTVFLANRRNMFPTANQVPMFPYIILILTIVLINPLCRLLRVFRKFSKTEILIIFIMCSVSSGISTFGLSSQLLPVIGGLFNGEWNNDQSEWNSYVDPFLNENFFLSESGIQSTAKEYRQELIEYRKLERIYTAAIAKKQIANSTDNDSSLVQENHTALESAIKAEGIDKILSKYPALIKVQNEKVVQKKAVLKELEDKAFEKVKLFRRGLPKDLRAFPGCIPVAEDNTASYFGRLRRLVHGKRAAGRLRESMDFLKQDSPHTVIDRETKNKISALLALAIKDLSSINDTTFLNTENRNLTETSKKLDNEIVLINSNLIKLNNEKRNISLDKARPLEKQIALLEKQKKTIDNDSKKTAISLERNHVQLESAKKVELTSDNISKLRNIILKNDNLKPDVLKKEIISLLVEFPSFDASLRRYFLGDIPWTHWVKPLTMWGTLIALTYLVLMTFNVLIFRQWAYNEKLVYPLAELPEILVGADLEDTRNMPAVFCNGLFWVGVAISGLTLGWNLLCYSEIISGLRSIDLTNRWGRYIANTPLAGISPGARSSIFFTMIGLSFLIPKKVSFSLWFFWILYMCQLLIMVGIGRGQNENSFPCFWWYTLNFRTAEGGGALMVFASVVLFKCRKYLFCAFLPTVVQSLDKDEQQELRVSSFLFLFGTLGLLIMLWKGLGVPLCYSIFAYMIIMIITIGLIRAVAEGGILGFQAWVSPFHLIRHIFGFDKTWTAPSFFAPLMTYYAVLFLDIKTFIAPAMANSLKIRDDLKMERGRFHIIIFLCIVISAVTAIVAAIIMSYSSGADSMDGWFYSKFPSLLFARLSEMSKTPPAITETGRFWLVFGALLMAALLIFRQRFFWIPHPIGLIMLVNPMMRTFWFSIFIGWIAKSLVTKYGNKDTYIKIRGLFIGLIVGELIIVALAIIVSLILQKNIGIDLNRN